MQNSSHTKFSSVSRITIDEKLNDNLIRVLIAELRPDVIEFNDDASCWNEEKEILVQPENFRIAMGMTYSNAKIWTWDSFYEGQVFLQGYFKLKSGKGGELGFLAGAERRKFLCINDLIKNDVKQIYFYALKGGAENG